MHAHTLTQMYSLTFTLTLTHTHRLRINLNIVLVTYKQLDVQTNAHWTFIFHFRSDWHHYQKTNGTLLGGVASGTASVLTCGAVRRGEEDMAAEERACRRAGLEGGMEWGLWDPSLSLPWLLGGVGGSCS